jgi:hypothetical protein
MRGQVSVRARARAGRVQIAQDVEGLDLNGNLGVGRPSRNAARIATTVIPVRVDEGLGLVGLDRVECGGRDHRRRHRLDVEWRGQVRVDEAKARDPSAAVVRGRAAAHEEQPAPRRLQGGPRFSPVGPRGNAPSFAWSPELRSSGYRPGVSARPPASAGAAYYPAPTTCQIEPNVLIASPVACVVSLDFRSGVK